MVKIEDIETWIRENSDTAGFFYTDALVNHFVNISKAELIEKACEWLKENADKYIWYDTNEFDCGMIEEFVTNFKQAMMEE